MAIPYIGLMPSKSAKKSSSKKAQVLSSKLAYKGPAFWVTTDQVLEPTGVQGRRDIVRHTGSVVIMPVNESGREPQVLLVRQYRHAAEQFLWELCAGRIDAGEKELPAAKRELEEETGYTARSWKRILKYYASPGFVAETMAIYLARGLKAGPAHPEEDEVIQVRFFPLSKIVSQISAGRVQDGKTICGVLWLAQNLRNFRKT
jgi:ADP-ribose pyrophosphatase